MFVLQPKPTQGLINNDILATAKRLDYSDDNFSDKSNMNYLKKKYNPNAINFNNSLKYLKNAPSYLQELLYKTIFLNHPYLKVSLTNDVWT